MSWQLIYTSAPRLLTAGQTGFGTVARHRDVPPLVVSAVERTSQFARLPGMDAGRVVFSHRVVDAAGARHHVVSRVASAGADYTGRTNHLAHHVILTAAEAAELAAQGVSAADVAVRFPWRSTWDETARWLDTHEAPNLAALPPGKQEHLSLWTEATGDPLHANHLVAGAGVRSGCIVIAPAKLEMRQLFAEALRAVPEQGWQFSFTTELDPGDTPGDFRWLGLSPGSPLLESVQSGRRLMLDLTNPRSLPTAEPLPEKSKAPVASSVSLQSVKRLAPPRVSAPAGGTFVEPPVELPLPQAGQMLGPMVTPSPSTRHRYFHKAASKDAQADTQSWRLVGFVVLGVFVVIGVGFLIREKMDHKPRLVSPSFEYVPSSREIGIAPPPPAPVSTTPPAVTTTPPAAVTPAPVAAKEEVITWRAAHASQLATLDLPQLRLEQMHLLIMSNGEERGPLREASNNLSLSLRDTSPVLKLDYAAHHATWSAAPESAAVPPVQWRILQDNREVLRVFIGDGSQQKPLQATPVSATQDEAGIMGDDFGQYVRRFGGQNLWLRPTSQAVALFRACGFGGVPFIPLRNMKGDTSEFVAWIAKEQARMQGTVNSPAITPVMPAGGPAPLDSDSEEKRGGAPRSKQTNTLENRPPPSSSVAGSMEQKQEQLRAAAQMRLDKLAELRGGKLMMGHFGPGTCSLFAGSGPAPSDAVWICDVVFNAP